MVAVNKPVISHEEENGLRLQLLLGKCFDKLRELFHQSFPEDPSTLYQKMEANKARLKVLKQKGKLYQRQWNLIFPQNKQTDSKEFDITLLSLLLRELCHLQPPATGWLKDPHHADHSIGASLVRMRMTRNLIQHQSIVLDDTSFNKFWSDLSSSLFALGATQSELSDIKQCSLDQSTIQNLQRIEQDLKSSKTTITHLQNCLKSIWWNVSPNVQNFVGRQKDVMKLHELIINASLSNYGAVVTGLGGVGKTELVKAYCRLYGEACYEGNVIWFDADGANALETSFLNLAEFLELSVKDAYGQVINFSTIIAKVYCFFATRKSLFVFDNVVHPSDITKYFPSSIPPGTKKPTILITSQYTDWCGLNFVLQNLNTFTLEAAEMFIRNSLKTNSLIESEVAELASVTEYLPLALQQAVSYILKNKLGISKYIVLFQDNFKILFSSNDTGCVYKNTVFTAWKMALDKLTGTEDGKALKLIHMMSYLNGKNINKDIFLRTAYNEAELNVLLGTISSYSLISIVEQDGDVIIRMHSLVQAVIRETAPKRTTDEILDLLQSLIDMTIADQFHFGDIWLEHVLMILETSEMNQSLMQRLFQLQFYIKQALLNKAKYSQCATFLTLMLKKIEPFSNRTNIHHFIDLKTDLAKSLQYSGKYHEARKTFLSTIEHEKALNRHGRIIMKKNLLGICCLFQGNYEESLNILSNVRQMIVDLWGETSVSLNAVEHGIALCLMHVGKYHDALKIFKENVEYGKQNYVSSIKMNEQYDLMKQEGMLPEVLTAKSCMATCLLHLKQRKKALKLFKSVEDERRSRIGELHPLTLQERCNTAACIAQYFDFTTGLEMLEKLEQQQKEILDEENHPQLLITKYQIAKSYRKKRRYEKAVPLLKSLYATQCSMLGENHPKTVLTKREIRKCKRSKCC